MIRVTLFLPLLYVLLASCTRDPATSVSLPDNWKFRPGDDPAWAALGFDDAEWDMVSVSANWEKQNYPELDGYAWYRLRFSLPTAIRRNAVLKDSVRFDLGKIDDFDEVYLNGELLGYNGITAPQGATPPATFVLEPSPWNVKRKYVLASTDPRIRWNAENQIAVRVYDRGGPGGIFSGNLSVSMVDIGDYLVYDRMEYPFVIEGEVVSKSIILRNSARHVPIKGWLSVLVYHSVSGRELIKKERRLDLGPGHFLMFDMDLKLSDESSYIYMIFKQDGALLPISFTEPVPYIVTPPTPETPRINGPDIFGVRPGKPFLYTIPATGTPPLTFRAQNLPSGLTLNPQTGIIKGRIDKKGDYDLLLSAENSLGGDTLRFTIVCGDRIALTPPMGWNSWNCWGLSVSHKKIMAAANSFVTNGLADYGWSYINIDDGWSVKGDSPEPKRDRNGDIRCNEKFPSMKSLGDSIHALGLRFGIYSSPGPLTCGGYAGSYGHETQDALTFAGWGVDFLKYDWCSYSRIAEGNSKEELQKPFTAMREALLRTNRDIVYSLCQYGMGNVWEWGAEAGGNLWRTTGDITDTWESVKTIGFGQDALASYAAPGHWNDPDMLVVGDVGWGPDLRPTRLTPDEQYSHISLWCLLSAPLLLGCNPETLDPFTMNLLANNEVLAINQDRLGQQAERKWDENHIQVWIKKLHNGNLAIGVFNLAKSPQTYVVPLSSLDLPVKGVIRDVWRQTDKGIFSDNIRGALPPHGVDLLTFTPVTDND